MQNEEETTDEWGEALASLRSPESDASKSTLSAALDSWSGTAAHLAVLMLIEVVALAHGILAWNGLSALYLVPLGLAGWWLGRTAGQIWAGVAAGVWAGVNIAAGATTELFMVIPWLAVFLAFAIALAALRRDRDEARALSTTDRLTGLHDGASFWRLVELERNRTLRYNRPFTVAYVDVDGLRKVNRELGHAAGDDALRLVATAIRGSVRSVDSVARVAGDEFALMFPETGQDVAEVALWQIQQRITDAMSEGGLDLTCTIGGVICVGAPESVDELIQQAEELMYQAKETPETGLLTAVLDENYGIEAILKRS